MQITTERRESVGCIRSVSSRRNVRFQVSRAQIYTTEFGRVAVGERSSVTDANYRYVLDHQRLTSLSPP